jgi:hypothetical protein
LLSIPQEILSIPAGVLASTFVFPNL